MGGGLSNFIPQSQKGSKRKDDLDLVKRFTDAGYSVVKDKAELQGLAVSKDTKILGLFSGSHMPYHIDKADKVSQSFGDDGSRHQGAPAKIPRAFFLMVEGGKLDMACHANDPVATVTNTLEIDNAVQVAMDYRKEDADTIDPGGWRS